MRWPWPWREFRASFTDTVTNFLVIRAGGADAPTGSAHLTAAVESCAGLWARAFASAEVSPAVPPLTPATLARIARSLIVNGESLHLIEVAAGRIHLIPVGSWDVLGDSPDPATWRYRVQLDGPSKSRTVTRPSAAVIHIRYSEDPASPWRGISPLARSGLTADLLSSLETRLSQEAGAVSALVIPTPTDGQDASTNTLRTDIKAAKGGVVFAQTFAAGYGDQAGAPQSDWKQKRIGADPPEVLRALRTDAGQAICSALGVHPSLLGGRSDGTLARESWRQFLHGAVAPVARIVADELAVKLDAPGLSFGFSGLYASDIVGRASAFKRLTESGVSATEAAAVSGILIDE